MESLVVFDEGDEGVGGREGMKNAGIAQTVDWKGS